MKNQLTEKAKARLFDTPKMLTARRHVELYGGPKDTAEYIEANWPKETSKTKTAIFHHLNAIAKADFSGAIKLPADAPFSEQSQNKNQSAEYGTPSNPCKPLSLDHRAPKHLSEQTLNAIEAREAMLKVADRLQAISDILKPEKINIGDLLWTLHTEAQRVRIEANELLGKAN